MIAAILVAEAAFWMFLLCGLVVRYLARARRASSVILAMVPLVDLALVVLVAIDVTRGAEPVRSHAFAAVYIGITVAFGHPIIRRMDAWFRYRFAGGPKPAKPPKGSAAEVRALWQEWFRLVLGVGIAVGCLLAMIAVAGWQVPETFEEATTHPYWAMLVTLAMVTGIWFLAGPAFAGRGDPALDDGDLEPHRSPRHEGAVRRRG